MFYEMIGFAPATDGPDLGNVSLPPIESCALFLNFDGVMLDLAATPRDVIIPESLGPILASLVAQTRGAVAVMSGRPAAVVQTLLPAFDGVIVGCHGGEIMRDGRTELLVSPPADSVKMLQQMVEAFALTDPAYYVECNPTGVVLHFRRKPELRGPAYQFFDCIMKDVQGFELRHASMSFELRPIGVSLVDAAEQLMTEDPFKGRVPICFGDDFSDEPVMEHVQSSGGHAVKVGSGQSCAEFRLGSPEEVRDFLHVLTARPN